jgi:FtsZ-binding cell division protein ZapB
MNDLKDSNETIKQTTDELKKQQDELKNIVDMLNNEKNDWVYVYIHSFSLLIFLFFQG